MSLMTKKEKLGLGVVIACIATMLVMLLFLALKWEADHRERFILTERTTFEGVELSSKAFISFRDVWMSTNLDNKKIDVFVEPEHPGLDWLTVEVESDIKGTLVSVKPKNNISIFSSCYAEHVVIHVLTEKEKEIWLRWAKASEEEYFSYHKSRLEPAVVRRILPPV